MSSFEIILLPKNKGSGIIDDLERANGRQMRH